MAGDEIKLDVELPKKLGMKAILLDGKGVYALEGISKPDFIVSDLMKAVEIFYSKYL